MRTTALRSGTTPAKDAGGLEPLRILGVIPPDHPDNPENPLFIGADGTYTVLLQLSRVTTSSERHEAVRLASADIRLFGSTMSLSHTTLETVSGTSANLADLSW